LTLWPESWYNIIMESEGGLRALGAKIIHKRLDISLKTLYNESVDVFK